MKFSNRSLNSTLMISVIGVLFLSGCGYMKIKSDPQVVGKNLQGGWTSSDTAIFIGCDGQFDFKRTTKNAPSDVFAPKYDYFTGGQILKITDTEMELRTFPGVHETIPVKAYPRVENGKSVMTLGATTWTLTRPLRCGENVGEFVDQFFQSPESQP